VGDRLQCRLVSPVGQRNEKTFQSRCRAHHPF
jgi:hypothetical protein